MNRLPNLLLTHGDLHHVGGFDSLAEDFSLSTVFTSPLRFRSQAYRRILERLERGEAARRPIHRGDQIGRWRVLHPEATDRFADADDGAIVLLGEFGGCRVLLLSDLGKVGQQLLLEREPDLRADLVIAGIPRRGEPLHRALLATILPRAIIIASGEHPASPRMNRALRQRLDDSEIPLISTDITGAATLVIQDHRWRVTTMSGIHLAGTVQGGLESHPSASNSNSAPQPSLRDSVPLAARSGAPARGQ